MSVFNGKTRNLQTQIWCQHDVTGSKENLTFSCVECLFPHKHFLKILWKSEHFLWRYKRKREWVVFCEHSVQRLNFGSGVIAWGQRDICQFLWIFVRLKIFFQTDTEFVPGNPPFWGNVLRKLTFWACIIFCVGNWQLFVRQEDQLLLGKANRTTYVRSPSFDFQSRRESDSSEMRQLHARCVNWMLSRKLQWTLVYQASHVVISPAKIATVPCTWSSRQVI